MLLALLGRTANGEQAYSCWNGQFYSLDLTTGVGTPINGAPGFLKLDYAPDGTLYGVSRTTNEVIRFTDPAHGIYETVGILPEGYVGRGMTVTPDGSAIWCVVDQIESTDIYSFNLSTAESTLLGSLTGMGGVSDLEFAPNGVLFAIDGMSFGTKGLFQIDVGTLAATAIGPAGLGLSLYDHETAGSLEFAPNGALYSATTLSYSPSTYDVRLLLIDPATGTANYRANVTMNGAGSGADTLAIAPTPEPSSAVLIAAAVGLFASRRRPFRR